MEDISRETLVALHETDGIGSQRIRELWQARDVMPIRPDMPAAELRDYGLNANTAAAAAANLASGRMEARRRERERAGIVVITFGDAAYPACLLRTSYPPVVLYAIGDPSLLSGPAIGVVGTRTATAYGRHVAEAYAAVWSERGVTVVSGMARGIDACAHRGALRRAGGTVAVLGMPVDQVYPPENRQLYREIAESGLLVSEAPPGARYHRGMFPSRNRIIAGLSLGLAIIEAPEGSGALITAEQAIEEERPVFVVPGPVTSPRSRGGMQMLRDGTAQILLDPEDALAPFSAHLARAAASRGREREDAGLPEPERRILALLADGPLSIDQLAEACGLPLGALHAALLALQLKQRIHQTPGSTYGVI